MAFVSTVISLFFLWSSLSTSCPFADPDTFLSFPLNVDVCHDGLTRQTAVLKLGANVVVWGGGRWCPHEWIPVTQKDCRELGRAQALFLFPSLL